MQATGQAVDPKSFLTVQVRTQMGNRLQAALMGSLWALALLCEEVDAMGAVLQMVKLRMILTSQKTKKCDTRDATDRVNREMTRWEKKWQG